MKNFNSKLFFLFLSIVLYHASFAQHSVSREINVIKATGRKAETFNLFNFKSDQMHARSFDLKGLDKGTLLTLRQDAVESLLSSHSDFLQIPVPVSERSTMVLTLKRNEIFTSEFALYTSQDPGIPILYKPGLHYKGIVEGSPSSLVAISVFHDQIMGMIVTEQGTFTLGKIKNSTDNAHVFYNDRDFHRPVVFDCNTKDINVPYTKDQLEYASNSRDAGDCVRVYIEIDDEIVIDKGGAVPATEYITGLFNQSFVLYANESINMMINSIFAWTTTSPYTGTASQKLSAYQANTSYFDADISHLVGYSTDGVAATINGICNQNPDLSKCYSGIVNFYWNVPTFSQSVEFITHEMGHLLGSRHTHACAWNGNNTAIDGCGTVEGSCPQPPLPPANTGTIMSYCWTTGFDFNLGFGPQPGNVIRSVVNSANNCLAPCGPPTSYCVSYGANSSNNKYIKKVVLGSINNTSNGNGGYGNFIAMTTHLIAGNPYTISLTPGNNGSNKYWRVWIDYNGDNDWNDAGEMVGQKTGSQVVSISFTVPSGASSISTRMRVSMSYNAYVGCCDSFASGEVEDYTIIINTTPVGNRTLELLTYVPNYDFDETFNPYITIHSYTPPWPWGWACIGTGEPDYDINCFCCGSSTVDFLWDCNDTDNQYGCSWSPCAFEVCNGIDDDENGLIDEEDPNLVGYLPWYADADGDGYGDPNTFVNACSPPEGYVPWPNNVDCDDTDPSWGIGDIYYSDYDGDGYGGNIYNPPGWRYYDLGPYHSCTPIPGFVTNALDCNDWDPNSHPGGQEICDDQDNDCDGLWNDEDDSITGQLIWYLDEDWDGYGNVDYTVLSCSQPWGYVGTGTDCNDQHGAIFPDAPELADGLDNDCDGLTDEGLSQLNIDAGDCEVVYSGYAPESCQTLTVNVSGGASPYTYVWSNGATSHTIQVCPTETTIYSVAVTDHNGLTAEDNVTVQVIDVHCGNNNNKVLVCHNPTGNAQQLCLASSAVADHLAHGDNLGVCNAPDPCDDSNEAAVSTVHHPALVSNQNIHADKKGIDQENSTPQIVVQPNPANTSTNIQLDNMNGPFLIHVFDLSGKVIDEVKTNSNPLILDTQTYHDGVYFIRIIGSQNEKTTNVVVLH
jgi:hypothetical protein